MTGLAGGHFMTIYSKSTNEIAHLNARETAPSYTREDMYEGIEDGSIIGKSSGLWFCMQFLLQA